MKNFLDRINNLKRTPRIGWLEGGLKPSEAEDVAQHTFETSAITWVLLESTDEDLDSEKALKMAIVHDWAESVTGDFSREMSQQLGWEVKKSIEETVMKNLMKNKNGEENEYLKVWRDYTKGESKEARLVKVADKVSILVEASYLKDAEKWSDEIEDIWDTVREELEDYTEEFPSLENILDELDSSLSSRES